MPLRPLLPLLAVLLFAPPVRADDTPVSVEHAKKTYAGGERLCGNLCLATLVGKSPFLAMGVGGAAEYLGTAESNRPAVGLFAQPWAWGPMLVVVLLVGFKDSLLTAFSKLKLPLDALAEATHAAGGVVGVAYLGAAAMGSPDANPTLAEQAGGLFTWAMMLVVHAAVWLVFNTVEVAILVNPIPLVDTALKSFRTLLVGVIGGAAAVHPVFGFVLALPVVFVCFWLLPLAVRAAVAGWVFTLDVFRWMFRLKPKAGPPRAFASLGFNGVPVGVYGSVERVAGGLEFVYRPWFVLRRRVPIPWERAAVASGVLPRLVLLGTDGVTLLRFPPRHRGQEAELALTLGLGDVQHRTPRDTIVGWWRRVTAYFKRKKKEPA